MEIAATMQARKLPVYVFTITKEMRQGMKQIHHLYLRSCYLRRKVFPLLLLPRSQRKSTAPPPPPAESSFSSLFEDVHFLFPVQHALQMLLTGKKIYECVHLLIDLILVPSICLNNEIMNSTILHLLRLSCYSSNYLFHCLETRQQKLTETVLMSVFAGFNPVSLSFDTFEQIEQSFASFGAILGPSVSTHLLIHLGEQFFYSRSNGYYLGNGWKFLDVSQERRVLVWFVQLVFRFLRKQTFAQQLHLIYRYFGLILASGAPRAVSELTPVFISLLHTIQARILHSLEVNMRRDSPHPLLQFTFNNVNLVFNNEFSPQEQQQQQQQGSASAVSPASSAFRDREKRDWTDFLQTHWWHMNAEEEKGYIFPFPLVRVRPLGDDDDKEEKEEEQSDSSHMDANTSEVYLFTQSDAATSHIMIVSMPYALKRYSQPTLSPFEFLNLQGCTFENHCLTLMIDFSIRFYMEDLQSSEAEEAFMNLFYRVYLPLKWSRHAASHLLDLLTSSDNGWCFFGLPSASVDTLIRIWSKWFRSCAYNLHTLPSTRLMELQMKIILSPYLSGAQKKNMVVAMVTAMEFHESYLFEPIEMYDMKHLLSLLQISIAQNVVPLIRLFFSMVVERFVQLVVMKLYDWMDCFSTSPEHNEPSYMDSYTASLRNPPLAEKTWLFSEVARQSIVHVKVPDWRESMQTVEEEEAAIAARSVFDSKDVAAAAVDRSSLRRVASFIRNYTPLDEEPYSTDREYEMAAETLLFRFMVGFANSTFFRWLVELAKDKSVAGIIYFLRWQSSMFMMFRESQSRWILERGLELKTRKDQVTEPGRMFYSLLARQLLVVARGRGNRVRLWQQLLQRKTKEAQLRALSTFVDAFPSFAELHRVDVKSTEEMKAFILSYFPGREVDAQCSICFERIDVSTTLGILTGCGHLSCLSCTLRSCFQVADAGWNRREQTTCPTCRSSVFTPQPEVPTCFADFVLLASSAMSFRAGDDGWLISRAESRAFVLPLLYVFVAQPQDKQSRKRKIS